VTTHQLLVRNTVWHAGVTVVGLLVGLLMSAVLARGLGPALMGDFAYIGWAARLLETVAMLAFGLAAVRYTATARAQGDPALAIGILRFLVRRQLGATAVVVVVVIPAILAFAPASLRWPFVIAVLTLFPETLEAMWMRGTYGAQRYDLTARNSTIKMSVQLLATVAALAGGLGLVGAFAAGTVATMVGCALQRRSAQALYPPAAASVPPGLRREIRDFVLPLSAVAVFQKLIWDRSEVFVLRFYVGPEDIAFYSLAFGLVARAMILPGMVVGALLPAFSALHGQGDLHEFRVVYRSAIRYAALIGTPLAAVIVGVATPTIELLYGAPYLPVVPLLRLLIAMALLGAVRDVAWLALEATGARRAMLTAAGTSFAVDLALAVVLIPRFGVMGAVAAAGTAQTLLSLWSFIAIRHRSQCTVGPSDLARILLAGTLAALATWLSAPARPAVLSIAVACLAGVVTYAVAGALFGVVRPREWTALGAGARRLVSLRPTA